MSNEFKVIYAQFFALRKIDRPLAHPKLAAAVRIALARARGVKQYFTLPPLVL
jgi:hypothetical protein